jgi:hypothetical protein
MHLRYRFAMPLVALSLALAFAPAMAAKTNPVPAPLNGGTLPPLDGVSGTSACTLGQQGASQAFQWFFPSDDYYYTFINAADCGCVNGIQPLLAHWVLFWPATCTINVQAWVVKAIDSGGGCYVPDAGNDPPDPTLAETLCGPTAVFPITGTSLTDHAVPFTPCAPITGPAFILWKIVNNVDCSVSGGALDSPAIVVDGSPDPCVSYNGFLGGPPAEMPGSFGFPGNTTMYLDSECAVITKTMPSTWGKVKTLYR